MSDDIIIAKKSQTLHATPTTTLRCRSVNKLPPYYFFPLKLLSCYRNNHLRIVYFYTFLLSYVTFDIPQIKFVVGHIAMAITL